MKECSIYLSIVKVKLDGARGAIRLSFVQFKIFCTFASFNSNYGEIKKEERTSYPYYK